MSSSGLIYAVIVGAWAAYLVPMWLRRQDELNEARPTERFSTAIRLLSGKAAMERRYARETERREAEAAAEDGAEATAGPDGIDGDHADAQTPGATTDHAVDVRAFANPRTMIHVTAEPAPAGPEAEDSPAGPDPAAASGGRSGGTAAGRTTPGKAAKGAKSTKGAKARGAAGGKGGKGGAGGRGRKAQRTKRAQVLARRRRTTMMLFVTFALGAVTAAVGGVAFLWAPAAPAALLSAYIAHLRAQERRRFTVTMDRRRAEEAARQLRERRTHSSGIRQVGAPGQDVTAVTAVQQPGAERLPEQQVASAGHPAPAEPAPAADRRALVERTDHAEWVDQQSGRVREQRESEDWDRVPVPLPTYVSAPVAPRRTTRGVDLEAPDTWSSARSSTIGGSQQDRSAALGAGPEAPQTRTPVPRPHERGRTPLFDQHAEDPPPRAANE